MIEYLLIALALVYLLSAMFWMFVIAFFQDHTYDVNWLETLCIVVIVGLTMPLCTLINDKNLKLAYRAENFVCGLFDPFRKK